MSSKTDDWKDPELQKARNESLFAGDPTKKFGIRAGLDEELGQTLADIQELLRLTFDFDFNILGHLREYFPDFDWEFHGEVKSKDVPKIIDQADYAWLKRPQCDYSLGMITARRKQCDAPRRFYFVWFDPNNSMWHPEGWPKSLQGMSGPRRITVTGEVT